MFMERNVGRIFFISEIQFLLLRFGHFLQSGGEWFLIEIVMSLGFLGTQSLVAVVEDKLAHQIDCGDRGLRHHVLVGDSLAVREGDLAVVRQAGDSGPALLCRSPEVPDDDTELVDVIFPREERAVVEQFSKDTAHGPEVDTLGVTPGAVEEFRSSVPACSHLVTVLAALSPLTDPTEAEVCDLESSLSTDQKVGGLQVAVHDLVVVEVAHALQQHQHVGLDLGLSQWAPGVLDHFGQVGHHELEYQHKPQTLGEDSIEPGDILIIT